MINPRWEHAADAYSSVGQIISLYAIALMPCNDVCTFRLRNPSLDEAFPVIEATCCLNVRPTSTSTSSLFCSQDSGVVDNRCSDRVLFPEKIVCSHFVALNDIFHFCSNFSSLVRSSWKAYLFVELFYRIVSSANNQTGNYKPLGKSIM